MSEMKELLRKTLQKDRRLLTDREALIARMDGEVSGEMIREFASLKTALQKNVGERFLAADDAPEEDQEAVCAEVRHQLVQDGMQEKRADGVVEAISYALGWGDPELTEDAMEFVPEAYDEPVQPKEQVNTGENLPTAQTWTCVCGSVNEGKFCVDCGRLRGQKEPQPASNPPIVPPSISTPPPPPSISVPPVVSSPTTMSSNDAAGKKILFGGIGAICVGLLLFGGWKLLADKPNTETPPALASESAKKDDASMAPAATPPATSAIPTPANQQPAGRAATAPQPKPATAKPENNAPARQASASSERLSLGGIAIGYDVNKVRSLLGKEKEITDPYKSGHLRYQYPNLEVVITKGTVTGFISKNAKVKTERGIHEGSTLEEVLQKYGTDYSKFNYEDSTMYEYKMKSINGKDCLQRFAIKNGKVDYVSCRVLEGQ